MTLDHGDVSIRVENNIIIAETKGAFNEYGARKYTEAVKKEIKQRFGNSPFSMLVNIEKIDGGTPEAFVELEKYNEWLNSQQLIAKAMVTNSQTNIQLLEKYSPSRAKQNIKNFVCEKEALSWLKSLVNL